MEQEVFTVGQLIGKDCLTCGVEQSHQVLTVTKKGLISKVVCAVCAVTSTFKTTAKSANGSSEQKTGEPYDRMLTYRKGQTMMHDSFGYGEVMSVIEPRKIDVKFTGGLRRLIHAQR